MAYGNSAPPLLRLRSGWILVGIWGLVVFAPSPQRHEFHFPKSRLVLSRWRPYWPCRGGLVGTAGVLWAPAHYLERLEVVFSVAVALPVGHHAVVALRQRYDALEAFAGKSVTAARRRGAGRGFEGWGAVAALGALPICGKEILRSPDRRLQDAFPLWGRNGWRVLR